MVQRFMPCALSPCSWVTFPDKALTSYSFFSGVRQVFHVEAPSVAVGCLELNEVVVGVVTHFPNAGVGLDG